MRIPLTPVILNKLARQLHCWLPTPKLVDQLHEASNRRLVPRPMTENRESLATFMEHHQLIEQQLSVQRDRSPLASNNFELIAGHKKDVVLSNQLVDRPRKVAIYGWHFPTGRYVQPTYVGHAITYVDYSHGIRLISDTVQLDGVPTQLAKVLANPETCSLLSDEGPVNLSELLPR